MTIIDDAKSIIETSGNNFHCSVINYFREKGWHTLVSPYYMDSAANKPREIDLVAEKEFPYRNDFARVYGTINVKLYIECKFIPQLNVFWFADKDLTRANDMVASSAPIFDGNTYRNDHHYVKACRQVAKLFAGQNNRTLENEIIYKALNQSLNAMVYLRNSSSIIPETRDRAQNILLFLQYPLIVCNSFDRFVRTDINTDNDPVKIEDNFQLEVNYAYMDSANNHKDEYFLIDVLSYNQLDNFLNIINDDVTAASHALED
jgi:hypothetical protein